VPFPKKLTIVLTPGELVRRQPPTISVGCAALAVAENIKAALSAATTMERVVFIEFPDVRRPTEARDFKI
jgi:hypothetical protein